MSVMKVLTGTSRSGRKRQAKNQARLQEESVANNLAFQNAQLDLAREASDRSIAQAAELRSSAARQTAIAQQSLDDMRADIEKERKSIADAAAAEKKAKDDSITGRLRRRLALVETSPQGVLGDVKVGRPTLVGT